MSDEPSQKGEEPRTILDQEQEVRSMKAVMKNEYPGKTDVEVEEAIGNAKRAVSSSDSRDKVEELVRSELQEKGSS